MTDVALVQRITALLDDLTHAVQPHADRPAADELLDAITTTRQQLPETT